VSSELFCQAGHLTALTTTYFNANANRLNRLATRLTVLATFFLIWTLVTSFFGQNFDVLSKPGFFWLMLVSVFGLPIGLRFWFKHKQWI